MSETKPTDKAPNEGENNTPEVKLEKTKPTDKAPNEGEKLETTSDGLVIGNKDTEKKFPFSKTWIKSIVVRQSSNHVGSADEDSSTARLMPYDVDVFENITKTGGFKGLNIKIIHQPK